MIGLEFKIDAMDFEESVPLKAAPPEVAIEIARQKASKISLRYRKAFVIGADTIVVLDNQILGKPEDPQDAIRMLQMLSGRTHEVFTGFAIVEMPENRIVTAFEKTQVKFRELEKSEIQDYVMSRSPMDKAGSYGIQDRSALFVEKIDGCFYNVVGFPLARFYEVCKANFVAVA